MQRTEGVGELVEEALKESRTLKAEFAKLTQHLALLQPALLLLLLRLHTRAHLELERTKDSELQLDEACGVFAAAGR